MGKRFKQRKKKAGVLKLKKLKEPCSHEGCKARARMRMDCTSCEAKSKSTTVFACEKHYWLLRDKFKAHVLKAHPWNIVRATGALLAGQDLIE